MTPLRNLAVKIDKMAMFEFSMRQILDDVILTVGDQSEIYFHGDPSVVVSTVSDVAGFLRPALTGDAEMGRSIEA